jgi:hypothetical protein
MRSAFIAFLAASLLASAPASATGLFSGYTVLVTHDVHTSWTDANGNTQTVNSTSRVIYPTGTTPPPNTIQQSVHNNSTSPGSNGNTQTISQTQTLIIVGHH